jgi:hypothetical protein
MNETYPRCECHDCTQLKGLKCESNLANAVRPAVFEGFKENEVFTHFICRYCERDFKIVYCLEIGKNILQFKISFCPNCGHKRRLG